MTRVFELDGFDPAYHCVVDPEFPPTGQWKLPVVAYSIEGTRVEHFRSRWGPPLIVKVEPDALSGWVGFFESGGFGGIDGAFATPNPSALCVVAGGAPYVIDVQDPSACWVPRLLPVTAVVSSPEANILILADFIRLAGIGGTGTRWESDRLCLDGLNVHEVVGSEIHCEGDHLEGPESFVVDARTGKRISGREFRDPFG